MAKTFETKENLAKEKKVIEAFCKLFGCSAMKMPQWDVDFLLYRDGKAIAFAEVKNYTCSSNQYREGILSLQKLGSLMMCSKYLEAILVAGFTDRIGWINVKNMEGRVEWGGRTQREGSANDMEFVLKYDYKYMEHFSW